MGEEYMVNRQIVSERIQGEPTNLSLNAEFMALLKKLDFYKYYPGKLKREEVTGITIEEIGERKIQKTEDLGMIFLHRLISCDYAARDLVITTESPSKSVMLAKNEYHCSNTSIFAKRKTVSSSSAEPPSTVIHPLDIVLSVFLCADPLLQQDIATLLWKCKLAIPFITTISDQGIPTAHIWPLRNICARWTVRKDGTNVEEEDNILSSSFFTIGFMRFQSTKVRKSIIINTLMSDTEKSHPFFYHRNSKGSAKKRLLVDGMVEISWYLPGRSSGKNLCNEPTTVLNLRGNALKYHKQREILMEMSSICFIVCSSSELDSHEVESVVRNILSMKKNVFVITYDDEDNRGTPLMQLDENVFIFNTESLTDAQLKENIKFQLEGIQQKHRFQRTNIATFSWRDVSVDQEKREIKDGVLQAEVIMKSLLNEETECRMERLLPLHQHLWTKWVETDKEIHRLKKFSKSQDVAEYKHQMEMEKEAIRKEQLNMLQSGLSEAISNFLKALAIKDNVTRAVCIRWLNIQMDHLSRRELRQLNHRETIIQEKINAVDDTNGVEHDDLQKELENLQELKKKSHIGLEHFFRELGQIYEAMQSQTPRERYELGYDLPLLAAHFLHDGNCFELFDGDAGYIPITWVSAVFNRLPDVVRALTGRSNPKCTTLTVYGMRSSGKSTLLNTMFGCQFAVGTGRYTRGAQIQMLKVNNSTHEEKNIDYILLVDTEGVRSPEMPEEIRRPRDNEMTTFVIGLGQKTLINLMGENTTYLTEVLPIAVRAFLRMESVGHKPVCTIVYHNVDSHSRDEISNQNRKLKEELDNQTHNACLMEKKENKQFQDVIKLDIENDIYCIPSLWEGEQPMATVSQGYSKGTLKLKNSFQEFCKECIGQDLVSYSLHVESLWTSITKDEFVFSFRNTLETEARERLDKFWYNVVWELRLAARNYGTKMLTDIKNCLNPDNLEEISITSRAKIRNEIAVKHEHLKGELDKFFRETPQKYKQYMLQWEASSIDALTKIRDDLIGDLKIDISRVQRLMESKFSLGRKVQQFKDQIKHGLVEYFQGNQTRADDLEVQTMPIEELRQGLQASCLVEGKGQSFIDWIKNGIIQFFTGGQTDGTDRKVLPAEEIRQLFEETWNGWLKTVNVMRDVQESKNNIARDAVSLLKERFSSHKALVIEKSNTLLSGKVMEFQLQRSHLLRNNKDITENTLISAKHIVQETIKNVKKRLIELTRDSSPYKSGSLEEIILMTAPKVNELEALGVATTTEFEMEIYITVLSIAVDAFSVSEKNFFDSFDPIHLLEMEKQSLFILFEKDYTKTSFSLSFAKRVSELLISSIKDRIDANIVREVTDDMRSRVFMEELKSKQSFIYSILCRMASDGMFNKFTDYIHNPTRAIEDWIAKYFDEYSSVARGDQSKLRTLVDRLVKGHVKDLTVCVKETEKQLDEKTDNTIDMDKTKDVEVKLWLGVFTQRASEKFDVNNVKSLADIFGDETIDLRYFYVELLKRIETTSPNVDDLTSKGKAAHETMRRNVVKTLRDLVVGCTRSCPFCGEICISSQPNHGGLHETPVHRPQGCKGYLLSSGRILHAESCQKLVAGNRKFINSKTNGNKVPYKDYQTIHTDWKIPADPNPLSSSFWEWFMFTYIENLETVHHAVRPDLPKVWKCYSKEGEIAKLSN